MSLPRLDEYPSRIVSPKSLRRLPVSLTRVESAELQTGMRKLSKTFGRETDSISALSKHENRRKEELLRLQNQINKKNRTTHDEDITGRMIGSVGNEFDELYSEVESELRIIRGIEKRESHDVEDDEILNHKFRKKKRIKPIKTLIKESIEKSLKQLDEDPEKLRLLKRKIDKHKIMYADNGSRRVQKRRIMQRNITELEKMQNGRLTEREAFQTRQKRVRENTLKRGKELKQAHLRRSQKLAEEYDKRLRVALNHKATIRGTLQQIERTQKWSFLVSFLSRFSVLHEKIQAKKSLEFETNRKKELTKIVFQRMIPIIRRRRRRKWTRAWIVYKKSYYFYRLWITVKRKKEATSVIKAFLKSAGFEIKFVKRVHQFGMNIKKCQYYIRKMREAHQMRVMVNILRYTVVESKILLELPLNKNDTKFQVGNISTVFKIEGTRSRPGTPNTSRKERPSSPLKDRRAALEAMSTFDRLVKPGPSGPFCLVRPTFNERYFIVTEFLEKRKKEFETAMPIYLRKMKKYNDKVQQHKFVEKANRLLKEVKSDDNFSKKSTQLVDENGRVIKKPVKPFFRIFPNDEEMEALVRKGFKLVRAKEEKLFKETKTKKIKHTLELGKEQQKDQMRSLFAKLKMQFKLIYDTKKRIFLQSNKKIVEISKQREYFHACNTRYSIEGDTFGK